MTDQKATNVHWHEGEISQTDRKNLLGQKGATLWFTGLPSSGKSTVSVALERELFERGKLSYRLDGDNIRSGINRDLGFSAEDRTENIRRIGEISKLFVDCHVISLASFISPYRKDRDDLRKLHDASGMQFIEVYVDCSLDVAEARDPKGLYQKARAGEIEDFTGIDGPYEAPTNPDIHLRTDQMSLEQEVDTVISYLEANGII